MDESKTMTAKSTQKLLQAWSSDAATDDDLLKAVDRFLEIGSKPFDDYEPSPYERFQERLDKWLDNVTADSEKRSLFRFFSYLQFIGRREFDSLYRSAFNGQVLHWIIDVAKLDVLASDFGRSIADAVNATWFCPITDSLRINSFLKANRLNGKEYRPDWRSLRQFGDINRIGLFIKSQAIERLVLLEDYVGSGSQVAATFDFAASSFPKLEILCCSLVISPAGVKALSDVAAKHTNATFVPIMSVAPERHLKAQPVVGEPQAFVEFRNLIVALAGREPNLIPDMFGYKQTGSLVVLYSNCPDNVPSIVHANDSWKPLFPRVARW